MINQIDVNESVALTKKDNQALFNKLIELYLHAEEAGGKPEDQNHRGFLRQVQSILPENKRKDVVYLGGRKNLSKKAILKRLKELDRTERAAKRMVETSEVTSEGTIIKTVQDLITQRVNKELDLIFSPEFKAQVEERIFGTVTKFEQQLLGLANSSREITGIVSGTFEGTFKTEVKQPAGAELIPFEPTKVVIEAPKEQEVVQEIPVAQPIIIEEPHTPIVKGSKSEWLELAVVGLMKRDIHHFEHKVDASKKYLKFHYFLTDDNKNKARPVQKGMDRIFYFAKEGHGHTQVEATLINYTRRTHVTEIQKGGLSTLVQTVLDWVHEKRRTQ